MDGNNTFTPPPGTSTHGASNLLCVPPQWTDYILFFASNYLAHVATLIQTPGQGSGEAILSGLVALFLPGSGALRAVRWLIICPVKYKTPVGRAAASGALCTVLEITKILRRGGPRQATAPSSDTPRDKEIVSDAERSHAMSGDDWSSYFQGTPRILSSRRSIKGSFALPTGYILVELPPDTPLKIFDLEDDIGNRSSSDGSDDISSIPRPMVDDELQSTLDRTSALIGLIQLLFGLVTLFRARGDQIDLYGYASFGLTVAPYAIVSIMNGAAALVTPQYPQLHLVHSPDMNDAIREGGEFRHVLASIDTDAMSRLGRQIHFDPMLAGRTRIYGLVASVVCALSPLALVGGLSGFKAGQISSASQRGWVLSWLLAGIVFPFFSRYVDLYLAVRPLFAWIFQWYALFYLVTFTPAIGGIVTSFLMMRDYGICTRY